MAKQRYNVVTLRKALELYIPAIIALGFAVVLLFPIVWMVLTSIKPKVDIFAVPPKLLPTHPTLAEYQNLFSKTRYMRFYANSWIISSLVTLVSMTLGCLAAYGFSRFRIRGSRFLLLATLALQMFPGIALIVPYFEVLNALHLYDTYAALIIADCSFTLPFFIWMMKSYFDGIPKDLEEAAMVDGASRLRALRSIVLPLSVPGLVGTCAFAFIGAWNEYMFAVILTRGQTYGPITLALGEYFTQFETSWSGIMALSTLASLPLMLIFVLLQRYVVAGMTAGAVK